MKNIPSLGKKHFLIEITCWATVAFLSFLFCLFECWAKESVPRHWVRKHLFMCLGAKVPS